MTQPYPAEAVERLKSEHATVDGISKLWCQVKPADLAALQSAEARIAKLEAALRELVEHCYDCDGSGFVRRQIGPAKEIKCPVCLPARAALGETDENAG